MALNNTQANAVATILRVLSGDLGPLTDLHDDDWHRARIREAVDTLAAAADKTLRAGRIPSHAAPAAARLTALHDLHRRDAEVLQAEQDAAATEPTARTEDAYGTVPMPLDEVAQ